MRRLVLALSLFALVAVGVADAGPVTTGNYKVSGILLDKKASATLSITKKSGRRYTVTRKGSVNGKSETWSAEGIDNGSRLVAEFQIVSSSGASGALAGAMDGANGSKRVRGVLNFGTDKVSVQWYEVKKKGRRLIGSESGNLSKDSDDAGSGEDGATDDKDGENNDADGSADDKDGENADADGENKDGENADGENNGEGDGMNGDADGENKDGEDKDGEGTGEDGGDATDETPSDTPSMDDQVDELVINFPKTDDVVLVGQVLQVSVNAEQATLEVQGAEALAEQRVRFTKPGTVSITPVLGEKRGETINLEVITAKATQIEVLDTIPTKDGKTPQYKRKKKDLSVTRDQAAVILKTQSLRLRVMIEAEKDLSHGAEITLVGKDRKSGTVVAGQGTVKDLNSWFSTDKVTVKSVGVLNDKVTINVLNMEWFVTGSKDVTETDSGYQYEDFHLAPLDGGATEFKVCTSFKRPVRNTHILNRGETSTVYSTFEHMAACLWAHKSSSNIGNGSDSIAWNVDNRMVHFVHHNDFRSSKPLLQFYKDSDKPPVNYRDLPSAYRIYNGTRPTSSLYYPPLRPKKDYEEYEHFRRNFGWQLLENKTHTGGRCNQQAALVCDILGTLGIRASVHYLQRVGNTSSTNRPARCYFRASGGGSTAWNFHGIVRATMEDGSEWLYDGSFSSPPNRLNGERKWAESEGGPFIAEWAYWLYEDMPRGSSRRVPDWDTPKTWQGVQ